MERVNTPETYRGALPAVYDRRQTPRTPVLLTVAESRTEFATYLRRLAAKVGSYDQRPVQVPCERS